MINNELVLTDTNSEFVQVRFEFVAIYIPIPAAPPLTLPHAPVPCDHIAQLSALEGAVVSFG